MHQVCVGLGCLHLNPVLTVAGILYATAAVLVDCFYNEAINLLKTASINGQTGVTSIIKTGSIVAGS